VSRLFEEMEATAKHDFQATADDELSFSRGARLKVGQNLKKETKGRLHQRHLNRQLVNLQLTLSGD